MPLSEELSVQVPATSDWIQQDTAALSPIAHSEPVRAGRGRTLPVVDKHYRSLLKAVSWRVTGTLDTIFISFLVTGKIKLAISIGVVEVFTKIGLFYVHERIWTRIPLGRIGTPEDYTI